MSILSSFVKLASGKADDAAKVTARATRRFERGQSAVSAYRASRVVNTTASTAGRVVGGTARVVTHPVRATTRAAARGVGSVNAKLRQYDKTKMLMAGSLIGGGALGVASGVRDTMRDLNNAAGDPVGFATSLSVRTAFSGNPANSRTKNGGASGDIPLNMGKR